MSFIYDLEATWNNIGTVFNGIAINVSNGAGGSPVYADDSLILNLKNDGDTVFGVDPLGNITTSAGFINQFVEVTSGGTATTAMNGQRIALGGEAYYFFELDAVSNYPDGYSIALYNVDLTAAKLIVNDTADFKLYPGQFTIAYIWDGNWKFTPIPRWRPPVGTIIYKSPTGDDENDGLSVTRPLATFQETIFKTILEAFDINSQGNPTTPGIIVQLLDGTNTDNIHLPGLAIPQSGNAAIVIQGNASAPNNTIIDPTSGGPVELFNNAYVQLKNMKLQVSAGTGGVACLFAKSGSKINVMQGITFGPCTGGQHQFALDGGSILHEGSYTVSGDSQYHAIASNHGSITAQSQAVSITQDLAFTAFVLADRVSTVNYISATINLNGHAVTGQRYNSSENAVISTGGGGANFFPGNAPGVAVTGQYS